MQEKRIIHYPVKNLDSLSEEQKDAFINSIRSIQGVVGCELDAEENNLVYVLNEWASEYDVLTEAIARCEEVGLELVIDDGDDEDAEIPTPEDTADVEDIHEEETTDEILTSSGIVTDLGDDDVLIGMDIITKGDFSITNYK